MSVKVQLNILKLTKIDERRNFKKVFIIKNILEKYMLKKIKLL